MFYALTSALPDCKEKYLIDQTEESNKSSSKKSRFSFFAESVTSKAVLRQWPYLLKACELWYKSSSETDRTVFRSAAYEQGL